MYVNSETILVRRTKEHSQETRQRILAAARDMFAHRGVTRTTLEQIAQAAGVTRGAIYWHFTNKAELFFAMREQVSLPIEDCLVPGLDDEADPLAGIERLLLGFLDLVRSDPMVGQTLGILYLKCEYVQEFECQLSQQIVRWQDLVGRLTKAYERARQEGRLRSGLDAGLAALETAAFLHGLLRLWLLDETATLIRSRAAPLVAAHVASRRLSPPESPPLSQ